jgi:catechol 2,3-dioxygenase-like lactoylglutathione lyase family enzyme
MLAYTTLGTNDLKRAADYYDALLGELGARRLLDFGRIIIWGTSPSAPMFAVCTPYDGKPATVGNGVMISLGVDSKAKVDALYKKAIDLGGSDEIGRAHV